MAAVDSNFHGHLEWLRRRDPNLAALRRAGRTAIVMPALFAFGDKVIGNPLVAQFAAFGSFALLLLVGFTGEIRERLQAQATLAVVGGVLVCVGTLASENAWLAVAVTAIVAFAVIFAGVVSSVLASASTSLLLALTLAVSLPGRASSLPDRLAGWGLASGVSLIAVVVLWPVATRDPLRVAAAAACRALAGRLRAEVRDLQSGGDHSLARDHDDAVARADVAVGALHGAFLAAPYRPTSLSTTARTVVRLVDEVIWLDSIVAQSTLPARSARPDPATCAVKLAAVEVLQCGADLLDSTGGDADALQSALAKLQVALRTMERDAMCDLPARGVAAVPMDMEQRVDAFVTSLDPRFRAEEMAFAVSLIGGNIDLTAAAERRSWPQRLLGRQPRDLSGPLAAARQRAAAHIERHSVWLRNSVRGAFGLGLALAVTQMTGVQHSFWVLFGTLSVLRSSALSTGQNAARALLGAIVGFMIGAGLLAVIGTSTTVLWLLLPVAVLFAGIAPATISYTAGQAAFTVTIVILFNIVVPVGWHIGLVRVEDVALGCAVSLAVGLLFWPRGAGAALRRALAEAYSDSAGYLAGAVEFGLLRCDATQTAPHAPAPAGRAERAAAAARRLDDTFRSYLAERGTKPLALAEVTTLVNGVAGLRLTADAVTDLWEGDDGAPAGDRSVARRLLEESAEEVKGWYDDLAASLLSRHAVFQPLAQDREADGRLVDAVSHDLRGEDGKATETAIRMIWTGDHLDAVRRQQAVLFQPARAASGAAKPGRLDRFLPRWFMAGQPAAG